MKKRNNKKQIKKMIEYVEIRIIAFFIFNLPVFVYILACYLTSNI